ncbi:hypothetical protein ACP4OV_012590 [Aristida adscensionis]
MHLWPPYKSNSRARTQLQWPKRRAPAVEYAHRAATDKKMSAPAPTPTRGGVQGSRPAPAAAEAVRFWERFIDADREAAEELFFQALLRDARAADGDDKDDAEQRQEEDRRRPRVFEPWQLPPPAPPLHLQQPVAVTPAAPRATLLGLRAPPHLQRRTAPAPAGDATATVLGLRTPPPLERRRGRQPRPGTAPRSQAEGI